MKIDSVTVSHRTKSFTISYKGKKMNFPFAKLNVRPRNREKIVKLYIDPETANEWFTYQLSSGREGSVPLDAVLEYNKDPEYIRKMTLFRMTVMALDALKKSGLSKRELSRRLKTSPSQIYRLLDTTNYKKSVDEMVKLLAVLSIDLAILLKKAA